MLSYLGIRKRLLCHYILLEQSIHTLEEIIDYRGSDFWFPHFPPWNCRKGWDRQLLPIFRLLPLPVGHLPLCSRWQRFAQAFEFSTLLRLAISCWTKLFCFIHMNSLSLSFNSSMMHPTLHWQLMLPSTTLNSFHTLIVTSYNCLFFSKIPGFNPFHVLFFATYSLFDCIQNKICFFL